MNDKYSLGSINNNLKIIGLIFITCILVIAILYYFKNSINKHKLIENFYTNGGKAIINTSSNYSSSTQPDGDELGKDNDKYNGEFKLRNCQVYFVGEDEKKDCDELYNTDPLRTTCKYEFKDDWKEIDTISYDNQENTITNKIYNKAYNNKKHIENHNYMTACFKNIDTSDNSFKYKDNSFIIHKNIGTRDDETAYNNTLRLNTEGGSSGKYISKVFNDSTNFLENNNNLLDSICSIKYDNIPDLSTKYYKFKLININNEWLLDDLKDVALSEDQTRFTGEKPSSFTGKAAFGIFVNSYAGGIVKFTVFKSSNIPETKVQVYRFKYNYLCDGQILEYSNNINTSMKIKEIFDNTDISEISNETFDLEFEELPIILAFWNNNNYKSMYYENKSEDISKGLNITLRSELIALYGDKFDVLIAVEDDIIKTNDGLRRSAEAEKTTFHTKYNINGTDEGSIVKEPIIGLPTNNIANFNYIKGYNIVVNNKTTSEPVGRFGGAEPILVNNEQMYPHTFSSPSSNSLSWNDNGYTINVKASDPPLAAFTVANKMFDNVINNSKNCYHSLRTYYGLSPFQYTGSTTFRGNKGISIYIDLGRSIIPSHMELAPRQRHDNLNMLSGAPGRFKIYASNILQDWVSTTSTTWDLIHDQTSSLSYFYLKYTGFNFNSNSSPNKSYRYYVIVTTHLTGSYQYLMIGQWRIYGKELLKPTKIDNDYKYISFTNNTNTADLFYNFTGLANDRWLALVDSIPNSSRTPGSWYPSSTTWPGVFVHPGEGFVSFILPYGYTDIDIAFGNQSSYGRAGRRVDLSINGVVKSTAIGLEYKTYSQSYVPGDVLRIEEFEAEIHRNLIIRIYNKTRSITFPEETECDILIVGGGGSGGNNAGGGGGAGGLVYGSGIKLLGTYNINVGGGGIGNMDTAGNGQDSSININGVNIIAVGGGGGIDDFGNGHNGGSGGGGASNSQDNIDRNGGVSIQVTSYTGTHNSVSYTFTGFGNNGGRGRNNESGGWGRAGGGGGGAGSTGNTSGNYTSDNNQVSRINHGGDGGQGRQYNMTGENKYYAGGGGGGIHNNQLAGIAGSGGSGIGGKGGNPFQAGTEGSPHTGSGGGSSGGGLAGNNITPGGNGGSGIVIIRYRTSLSNEELIKRSSEVDKNAINYIGQSLTYFGNDVNIRENTIWRKTSTDTKIESYRLKTITIMSYMFLQRATTYNFETTLGIKSESIIYMDTMFAMGDNINIIKTGQNKFTTNDIIDGGFYIFSYTCEILLNKEEVINFGIKDTISETNIRDYLYAGLKLHTEQNKINSNISNNKFVNILFKNNTEQSMRIISDYLDDSQDHYKIDIYDDEIEDANDRKKTLINNKAITIGNINSYIDKFLIKLSSIDYTDPKWFTTTPPTLKVNPKPSDIFKNYNETDYVTYEKIENINDRTPTVTVGDVGRNPSTNFKTINYMKRSIYVLRS